MRRTDDEDVDHTRRPTAEREVIGTVIRAPVHADEAMRLRADDFTVPIHQVIWRAIAHLLDKGDPIRLQSVAAACGNALDGHGRRDLENMVLMAGGTEGILRDAIGLVTDSSRRRAAATAFNMARRRAVASEDPIESTAARAAFEVEEALNGEQTAFLTGQQAAQKLRRKLENPPKPVPTGIRKLDHVLEGGLMATRMLAIGAQTKQGKTTLAATISHNVLAIEEPHLVISLEKHETDIEQACAARALKTNTIALEQDFDKYRRGYDAYEADEKLSLRTYHHQPGATIEDIQMAILRAKRAGARGFILDYWQLIQKPPRESLADHLARCAQILAQLTDRLGMWSVVNAQTHADGVPRECQALWLAASSFYVIRRDVPDKPDTWLECLGSNYTKGLSAGGSDIAAMMLDTDVGPHFRTT